MGKNWIIVVLLGIFALPLKAQMVEAEVNSASMNSASKASTYKIDSMAELSTQMALTEDAIIYSKKRRYSKWSKSWFNWATQSVEDTNNGVGRLESYNHLSLNYRLDGGTLSFRPTFFLSGAGNNYRGDAVGSEFEVGNVYFQYSRYNLALLPGEIGLTGAFRVYLPNSENDKEKQSMGQIRGKFYFNKPWGAGWNTTLMVEPRYYFFKERGFIKDNFGSRSVRANKYGEFWWYIEHAHLFNSTFGVSAQTGIKHQWYYDIPSENIQNEIRDVWQTAFYGMINVEGVMFKIGIMQDRHIRKSFGSSFQEKDYKFFRPDESEYSIMTYVRL